MTCHRWTTGVLLVLGASACATPGTELPEVSPEAVAEEERVQRELVVAELLEAQQRLDDLIHPLLVSGASLCEEREPRRGFRFQTASSYEDEWAEAARAALNLSDTVTVVAVTEGSPAARAGLEVGDRVLEVDGSPLSTGMDGVQELGENLAGSGEEAELRILRDSEPRDLALGAEEMCPYGHEVIVEGDVNAFADGENVIVPWAMMRFASDQELQVILAHEIAHNAMGHIDAQRRNMLLTGMLGALADVAAASQGVATGGQHTADFMELGARAFSQDFEREADYVGMYILARADLPLEGAPELWRRFAQLNPDAIGYAYSHPTTAERFVRLRETIEEIEAKAEEGEDLMPDFEEGEGQR